MIPRATVKIRFFSSYVSGNPEESIAQFFRDFLGFDGEILLFPSARSALFFGLRNHTKVSTVIVPAYNCQAVQEAVSLAGKETVFVDVEQYTCQTDFSHLVRLRHLRHSALLATHQYGIPEHIYEMREFCRENDMVLIEDCAAAIGTKVGASFCGTFGDFSVFSFDLFKTVPVPFGLGVMLTKNHELVHQIRCDNLFASLKRPYYNFVKEIARCWVLRFLAIHGVYSLFHRVHFRNRDVGEEVQPLPREVPEAYRYRIGEFHKKRVLSSLKTAPSDIARRRCIARQYWEAFRNTRGIVMPFGENETFDALSLLRFPLFVENPQVRRQYYTELLRCGVDTGRIFPFPLPGSERSCPNSLMLSQKVITLPFNQWLTDCEVARVACAVCTVSRKLSL